MRKKDESSHYPVAITLVLLIVLTSEVLLQSFEVMHGN